MANHRCYVCGFDLGDDPWGSKWVYEYCPCCGVQFSYEDATMTAVQKYRAKWSEDGFRWKEPERKPERWSPETQLALVPKAPGNGLGPK